MIIQIVQDGVTVVDTFSVAGIPTSGSAGSLYTRSMRSNSTNFPTPAAGAHTFTVQARLEVGDGAGGSANVPANIGNIVAMPVKSV